MDTLQIESCVRGHHIYKNIWTPFIGEELTCICEPTNAKDPYAVTVLRRSTVVGHVPRKISAACSLFLGRNGTSIHCRVTAARCVSTDLLQGGLEVPCLFVFRGEPKDLAKVLKLATVSQSVQRADSATTNRTAAPGPETSEPPRKMSKIVSECEIVNVDNLTAATTTQPYRWLSFGKIGLTGEDKICIESGDYLSDKHVNFAQELLKAQFPEISGLQSTLLLVTHPQKVVVTSTYLQIIHSRGNHWIVATNIGCAPNIQVFDSLYSSVDKATGNFLKKIFGQSVIEMGDSPHQDGTADCALYTIATCVALASGQMPGPFIQERMRAHLVRCFENYLLTPFPC